VSDHSTTSKRQIAMDSAIFLIIGVLLSGIAVIGTTVFDQSFRIPGEVPQLLNLPILAFLPDTSRPAPKYYWGWKRKKSVSDADEPPREKIIEARTLPASPKELADLASIESSRKRKNKKQVTIETPDIPEPSQDHTSNAFDLPTEHDPKPGQNE
jgi:hypothetical protein